MVVPSTISIQGINGGDLSLMPENEYPVGI
jgi:hypothetical protein